MADLSHLRRIHEALERVSPAERRIADVMLESLPDVVALRIMRLAWRANGTLHTMTAPLDDRRLPFGRAAEPVITGGREGRTVA